MKDYKEQRRFRNIGNDQEIKCKSSRKYFGELDEKSFLNYHNDITFSWNNINNIVNTTFTWRSVFYGIVCTINKSETKQIHN